MCEELKGLIENDIKPFLQSAVASFGRKGDEKRVEEIETFLRSLEEVVEDIDGGVMDGWECGELYEEFKSRRESGDFLDKIC